VGFFWDRFNTHQCSYVTRADRRVEGLVAEGWVYGWSSRFKLISLRRISLATFAAFGGAHNE
jgi:hypothetical protein